jgi:hypothetical protein
MYSIIGRKAKEVKVLKGFEAVLAVNRAKFVLFGLE